MNFAKRDKSIVDFLFILALFCAFMVSALMIVLFGAKIYQKTVADMDANFASRTALSYVTEKIHSHDYTDGADVGDIDVASVNGHSALTLMTDSATGSYITYLFVKDGYLTEYTGSADSEFNYDQGTKVLPIKEFTVNKETKSLYSFHVVDGDGRVTDFFVSLYSESDEEAANE